ncbi:hypothetical protein A4X13_0g3643 [Tilletia indica]|uniref:Uncharacterized protein n=1 Tax=Tilletia indica TaxID=43049 RepID=A0A177TWN0_9BASI|nr:hypothetical protein A4X13_0g3643 [Tilletia indica]
MAASSSSSSASSFGRLLQSTRISTWDPTIPQLYTAPAAFAARGQYGFKRPVPVPQQRNRQEQAASSSGANSSAGPSGSLSSITRARNIDLVCPDTPAGIAVWATDSIHPRFIKTFEEKGVKLLDFDNSNRRETNDRIIPNPTTEPLSVFDANSRRVLPSEVAKYPTSSTDALDLARSGLARPNGATAVRRAPSLPSYSYSGVALSSQPAPSASTYTSLDIVPNYARMTERQFEAYLERIRTTVRPALIRHLAGLDRTAPKVSSKAAAKAAVRAREAEDRKLAVKAESAKASGVDVETADAHAEIAAGRASDSIPVSPQQQQSTEDSVIVDMWDASRALSSSYTTTFVRSRFAKDAVQPKSSILPSSSGHLVPNGDLPPLHPNGGLQYGGPDEIYTARLGRPAGLPAHVLHRVEDVNRSTPNRAGRRPIFSSSLFARGGAAVSLGGHVAHIPGPIMPRQVTSLESMYESADTASSGPVSEDKDKDSAEKFPSHLLVRPIGAYQSDVSSSDRARQIALPHPPAPTGVSGTAALAASAAGRPIGSAREHVVLPDPTSIHVRVRPVYMDEVLVKDNRPLSSDRESSTPGSRTYIGVEPKRLALKSELPGVVPASARAFNKIGWSPSGRTTLGMASDSMRVKSGGWSEAGAARSDQLSSMFSEVSKVGASASRGAVDEADDGLSVPRLPRTSVGPASRRKHQSNIKK